jgi:replicative DNA helicase
VDDQLAKVMEVIEDGHSIKDAAVTLKDDFSKMLAGEYDVNVVRTHLPQLDGMLGSGGIGAGEVMTLSAPTSCGKSALALHIALKAVRNDAVPTLIFSLEMPQKQITKRMVQCVSGRNVRQIQERVISDANMEKVNQAVDEVAELPIYTAHSVNSPQDLVRQARIFVKKHGVKLVLIDYLQLIPWSSKANSKAEGIADISHKIKQMALELDVSVILLSQVNREGAKRETGLSLYDLKDSGDIENDADIVLLMWPKNGDIEGAKDSDSKGPFTELQYTIAKNREGERGVGGYLKFYHCLGRFQ